MCVCDRSAQYQSTHLGSFVVFSVYFFELFQVSPEIAALREPFVQLPFDAGNAIQKTSVRRRSTSFSQIVHGHYAIMFLYECSITLNFGFCVMRNSPPE